MNDMTKSSLKFSHHEPAKMEFSTPSTSVIKNESPKTNTNNAITYDTPKISASDKNQKVSPADDTESDESKDEVKLPKTKSINNKIVERDDSQDSYSIAGSSSPIEIKKEYISPRSDIFESSEGNSTPSEHGIMVENARLGKISEKIFIYYVSKVVCAPQGRNLAEMDLDSDPLDQSSSDIEI
ncbi:hypothetical protein AYI70_g699 [Smittium culicis]|uniref:Uncharacterized protein n=1 Tax=Smittium culicis TaxID=133412 RepID=A0A1R1X4I2_9FUNG|nr:hypothetical protein AYI70_g10873 [Smittium culicis]OMJ25731.1 hypothetical protein AYI70_g699 [Smittium culicis]